MTLSFLTLTRTATYNIKLKFLFQKYDLKLIFREISHQSKNKELQFLDANHIIDDEEKGGFYVRNYIKPTAINRVYINGRVLSSSLNLQIYGTSESIRLRRLCERDCDCWEALKLLKDKCIKSYFCEGLVVEMLERTEK